MKHLFFLGIVLLTAIGHGYRKKAYEPEYYTGKAGGYNLHLTLGNGYLGATELTRKNADTQKKEIFYPDSGVPDEKGCIGMFKFDKDTGTPDKEEYYTLYGMQESYGTVPTAIQVRWHGPQGEVAVVLLHQKK